jgi:hypothetical protein
MGSDGETARARGLAVEAVLARQRRIRRLANATVPVATNGRCIGDAASWRAIDTTQQKADRRSIRAAFSRKRGMGLGTHGADCTKNFKCLKTFQLTFVKPMCRCSQCRGSRCRQRMVRLNFRETHRRPHGSNSERTDLASTERVTVVPAPATNFPTTGHRS